MTDSTLDVPPEYFFYLQYHVVKQRELELGKVLEGMGLTISKWRILSTINRLGRCSMGVVADFCAMDRTTLTRTMDQLEAAGYVARRADAKDRRQTLLDLTEAGQAAYDIAVAAVVKFNTKALNGVEAGELAALERLLRKVVYNVMDDQDWADSILRFERGWAAMIHGSKVNTTDPEGEFETGVPEYFFSMMFQVMRRREGNSEKLLKPLGQTAAVWRALLIIERMQPCTMNQLARMSTMERTTLTRMIDQLVAEGMAERSTPPEDRRQVRLSLTQAGVDALDAGKTAIYAAQAQSLAGVDQCRLRDATRLLQEILTGMIDDPATAKALLTFTPPPENLAEAD